MADKINILNGKTSINLNVKSHTKLLSIPRLNSWATFDDSAFTIINNRIVAVQGRKGSGLIKNPDSLGPLREIRNNLSVAKFTNNELNYLHFPIAINGNSFTMAAVVYIDAYTASTRDLMALFETGNSVRVWRSAGRYDIRFGSTVILAGSQVFNQSGWHIIIWSQHNGEAALRIQRLGSDPVTQRVANTILAGTVCTPIIGADEIANGTVGATPSAGRFWQDCIAEFLVWDNYDLLAEENSEDRANFISYINTIYGTV